ncbi:MAG: T9SS type A sorting domain-containing protein [Bacteroidia bacterium]
MPSHTMHHQYKILSDFINVPYNGLSSNMIDFTDDLTPYQYFGPDLAAPNNIESYYLVNSNSDKAWGWVHNLDHYWAKKYITTSYYNLPGGDPSVWDDVLDVGTEIDDCQGVITTTIYLDGFEANTEFQIIFYQTFANVGTNTGTWLTPGTWTGFSNTETTSVNGILPMTVTLGCDSTDGDYGFYIVKNSIPHREMPTADNPNSAEPLFDFAIHPPVSRDIFDLTFDKTSIGTVQIDVKDLLGKIIFHTSSSAPFFTINLSDKLPGIYFVTCSDGYVTKTKRIIKL